MTAQVIFDRVTKAFPGNPTPAICDVSFEVDPGHALALVGENGAGKSTVLDLALGVTAPSSGRVDVAEPVGSLLEPGAGLFLELSAKENAVHAGVLLGKSRTEAAQFAEKALAFAEIDRPERALRTLSAGTQMRLGFALAAQDDVSVLLVDEALAVGDGYFQRKCINRILELKQRGTALLVAGHDLHALRGLCDSALWLKEGRVERHGPASETIGLYEEHLRRRTGDVRGPEVQAGTGEIEITNVRITDDRGNERTDFSSGDTLRVEVSFRTTRPISSPTMGVAIFRDDGVYCTGPNTKFDGVLSGLYDGSYVFCADFEDPPLLTGVYEISVAFYDADHIYAYAWRHRAWMIRFSSANLDHGLVRIPHRFSVSPPPGPQRS